MTNVVAVAPDVASEIEAINALHGQVIAVTKMATKPAIEVGNLLNALKKSVKHGQFGGLVKQFSFSEKTGQNYMGLARYAVEHPEVAELDLFDAYCKAGLYSKKKGQGNRGEKTLTNWLGLTAEKMKEIVAKIPKGEHSFVKEGETLYIKPLSFAVASIVAVISAADPSVVEGAESIVILKGE